MVYKSPELSVSYIFMITLLIYPNVPDKLKELSFSLISIIILLFNSKETAEKPNKLILIFLYDSASTSLLLDLLHIWSKVFPSLRSDRISRTYEDAKHSDGI